MPRSLCPAISRPHACLAAVAVSVAVIVAGPTATASAAPLPHQARLGRPSATGGWQRVFYDSFKGAKDHGVDSSWKYDTGPGASFGTGETETMTRSVKNVHLSGTGGLDITAVRRGGSWTSGRVQTTTAGLGAPAGGELELTASIRQPDPVHGRGYWPAFWMLGPGHWPETGEISILEDVNARSEHSGTFHCGTFPGGPCHEGTGITSGLRRCPGCQRGFHTYTLVINRTDPSAESITWSLDGRQFFTVDEDQLPVSVWRSAVDHDFSVIFDLAIGGDYPDAMCACTTPGSATTSGGTLTVKYVAAYTKG